ncbi:MAG: hypothetical protein C0598_01190, partial [Marinilabiliales bacterium]
MKKLLIIALGIVLIGVSCTNDSEKSAQKKRDKSVENGVFALKMNNIEVKDETCDSSYAKCTHVVISYPVFTEPKMNNVNDLIRNRILYFMGQGDVETTKNLELKDAANNFIKEYAEFKTGFPDTDQFWMFRLKSRVSYVDNDKISILMASDAYTGGAHANQNQVYMNFDSHGNLLKAEDFIGDLDKLRALAEANFRMRKGLKEGESLQDAGFNFPDNKFVLPSNIGIADSLYILHYNSYEISGYSEGPTQLLIKMS